MRRLFGFLLRAALLIAAALWLANHPGTARIVWQGYVIECSAAVLGLMILGLGFGIYFVLRLWRILRDGPALWRLRRQFDKMQQGHEYLTQGLVAVAGGHAAEAGRLAVAARKKLGTTTATLLLQAQAAQLAQDHSAARSIFRAMIEDDASAILGYRGLIMEARRAGAWDEVERLTAEIAEREEDMPWLDRVRFESATRRQAWIEAGEALARLAPTRLLDPATLQRHRAALLVAISQEKGEAGNRAHALEHAEQAIKQAPQWMPAWINLAQQQARGDYTRALRRTVEKGWAVQPHPQLAAALRSTVQDPMDSYKQIERLCRCNPDHPTALLALAEAAFAADLWGAARRALMMLVSHKNATQAAYRLLARLERRESGDERAAMQWLSKAVEASPHPAWLCSACGGAHEDWQASCSSCASFATLEWRSPGAGRFTTHAVVPLLSDWSE